MGKQYETVIGLEVHVELAIKARVFCGCSTQFGGTPNTHTYPACTGMPGSLPALNKQVVKYALIVGLTTNCRVDQYHKFNRESCFYPDNPQNHQISQLYLPVCRDGWVNIETKSSPKKRVRTHEIHTKEDTGRLTHDEWESYSLVDYSRNGVPLIKIVLEPNIRSAEGVIACLEKLRLIIQYLGASDCKFQEGSMRADVNLSVREVGVPGFGTRTEMKNLNSFKAVARAIEGERRCQIELLEEGRQVIQEMRRWDDNRENPKAMQSKGDAQDYRYLPDPDLVSVAVNDEWIAGVRTRQPELCTEKTARYKEEYGLPEYDARFLTSSERMADIFEGTTRLNSRPKEAPSWLMVEVTCLVKEQEIGSEDTESFPSHLAAPIHTVENNIINRTVAKTVFEEIFRRNADPEAYVEENSLKVVKNESALRDIIKVVMAANSQSVEDYRNGGERAMGLLVGQTMKAMKGKADSSMVNWLIRELLAGGDV